MTPLALLWVMLKASLLSTGGGNIPILHQDLIAHGWTSEEQFAEALAIGQVSPGPTGLWVIAMGYLMDGVRGALLALVAIALPPLLVLVVHSLYQRFGSHPAMGGFVRGLTLAVAGILLTVLGGLMVSTGVELRSLSVMLAALAIGSTRRVPVIVVLVLAAAAGIALY
jgi:chromate transporter